MDDLVELACKAQRGGRWPAWMLGVDIDELSFSFPIPVHHLAHLLLRCPEADISKIINKGLRLIIDGEGGITILAVLDLLHRHELLRKTWFLITEIEILAEVIQYFPAADRKALIIKGLG